MREVGKKGGAVAGGAGATIAKKLDAPESLEHIEARIRTLQRTNEPLLAVATELHRHVAKLAEDYERLMNILSKKLLKLDAR